MNAMKQAQSESRIPGYNGKILRVDLTKGTTASEALTEAFLKDYPGGASMGS